MDEETKRLIQQMAKDVSTLALRADAMDFKLDEMHADMDLGFSLANDSFEKLTRHIDGFAGLHRDDRLEKRILRLEQRPWCGR